MELRIYKYNNEIKYAFDVAPKEESDLRDEIWEAIIESNVKGVLMPKESLEAILGTLANWGIVIE